MPLRQQDQPDQNLDRIATNGMNGKQVAQNCIGVRIVGLKSGVEAVEVEQG